MHEVITAVVVNPTKIADLDEFKRRINAALADVQWPEAMWMYTTPIDGGFGQAKQALDQGAQIVFACGGDGTVRQCARALLGTSTALGILPMGTGNLLAKYLQLPFDVEEGIAMASQGAIRRLDVGEVEDQCFLVMAGVGFDAKMVGSASESLKAKIGIAAYVWSAAQRLLERPIRVSIRLDDGPALVRRARSVLVGNVDYLPGGGRLMPASPDDGKLAVAVISPRTVFEWLRLLWGVIGRAPTIPRVEVLEAQRVEVECERTQPCELDGDALGGTRCFVATVRKAAIRVCVPPPNAELPTQGGV